MKQVKLNHCVTILRYLPVVGAFVLLIHTCLLIAGYYEAFSYSIFGFSTAGTIVLILASLAFHFCNLHRLFITYNEVVGNCVIFEKEVGFDDYLAPARLLVVSTGVLLFICLIFKFRAFNGCCN